MIRPSYSEATLGVEKAFWENFSTHYLMQPWAENSSVDQSL